MTPPRLPWRRAQAGGSVEASGTRAVFIGGNANAPVLTGDHARAVTLPPLRPMAEIAAPPGLDDLPHHAMFVGRTRELDQLDTALATPGEVVVQAVHGLGGIGKSALAAHWAATRARPRGYAPIRWITADSAASVQQGLADLATALQPALAQAVPVEERPRRAMEWLASHTRWLLILDNVNDRNDINALLGCAATGRFLITSRLAAAWPDATTILRLDVLDEDDSLALLTRTATAPTGPRDMDGAADLCAELGHLALAIEQAAAYLAQTPLLTPCGYLDLLAQAPADLYQSGGAGVTDSERTIARTWRITLDRIHQTRPLATDLLRILAWYAPDHIPATLLESAADPPASTGALGLLTAYSMVTADPGTHTLAVHRLVQALARTPDPDDPHRAADLISQARDRATARLRAALPSTEQDPAAWPIWRLLLPHIDALADHASPDTDTVTTWYVLNNTAMFLIEQGSSGRAIRYLERALAVERVVGRDPYDTLLVRNNLAYAYRSAEDLDRAISLYEQAVNDAARVLGKHHQLTLTCRNNLAWAYQAAGNLERAIPLCQETLKDREKILGNDHPGTLASRDNLASAYQAAGNLERATPLFEQTLKGREKILGNDHPETLISRDNLAYAYRAAGNLERAIPLCQETLKDREKILGKDHPKTLVSRDNLAGAYQATGNLERAIPLLEQTVNDAVRVLGNDHPLTLSWRNNLACAYHAAGNLERAIPLLEQTVNDAVRVLGNDHRETLNLRHNLASAYQAAGNLERATPLFEQTLKGREKILGNDHPQTLVAREKLAYAYQAAGNMERAIPLCQQILKDTERAVGKDHPLTLTWRNNLGCVYAAVDLDRAIPLFEQAITGALRVLGKEHPKTKKFQANLADALGEIES